MKGDYREEGDDLFSVAIWDRSRSSGLKTVAEEIEVGD